MAWGEVAIHDLTATVAVIAFTFLLAGLVKGVIGLGLPTVAMGLLGLVMPPVQAAALLVVPSLVTNVWQLIAGPRLTALARRFATMMLGVCLGTAFGIGLLTGGATTLAATALGGVLAAYGALGLVSPRFALPPNTPKGSIVVDPFGFAYFMVAGARSVGPENRSPLIFQFEVNG